MNEIEINSKIYKIRNKQVMLDSDLAKLYQVETKVLNQAVKRNKDRFPQDFCFQLNDNEKNELVTICDHLYNLKFSYQNPYAFTQEGVSMLSGILKSKIAIEVNIKIMRAFVQMRHFIHENALVFQRLDKLEFKLNEHDKNFEKIFNALNSSPPKKGIFYNGQIFDAYSFVSNLIKQAKNQITLIDNYIDETTLTLLCKKQNNVKVKILTNNITEQLKLDINKFNEQYKNLEISKFKKAHDRFLIIDKDVYHFGASLKDLGKKIFGFSKFSEDFMIDLSKY